MVVEALGMKIQTHTFYKVSIFVCQSVLSACLSLHHGACGVSRSWKKALDPLEVELQTMENGPLKE